MDKKQSCEDCSFRARYDNNPKSFLGRLWRWHAGWCPAFKKYITSLPDDERIALASRYGMEKHVLKSEDKGQDATRGFSGEKNG